MTVWSTEAIKNLRRLYDRGDTMSQIAVVMGYGFTRNSVVGKLHRLGLVRGHAKPGPKKPRRSRARIFLPGEERHPARPPRVKAEPPSIIDDYAIPIAQRCTLFDLTDFTCRWPCGHPGEREFFFCGAPTANFPEGRPYCRDHAFIAFVGERGTETKVEREIRLRNKHRAQGTSGVRTWA